MILRPEPSPSRRVLMICHAFPPTGGPGVQRSLKFAKYLPEFGWRPYIWSAGPLRGLPADPTLQAEVPACAVRRTSAACELDRRVAATGAVGWRAQRIIRSLLDRLVPDDCLDWALRSYAPLLRWVRGERMDAIYSTYSPASNHLLGLLLRRATGLPWVADFRDLWTDDYAYHCARAWQHRANVRVENRILHDADSVVCVSDPWTDLLRRHVDTRQAGKFHTIMNAADLDDFDLGPTAPRPPRQGALGARFTLTFVGHAIRLRFPPVIREGLSRFCELAAAHGIPVCLRMVGLVSSDLHPWVESLGADVECLGYREHGDAVAEMVRAHALLLTVTDYPQGCQARPDPSAKLFEYLAAQRPIFLIGPADTVAARIVSECRAGVCSPLDAETIGRNLLVLAQEWSRGELRDGCPPEKLAPYTREGAARQLAALLNGLATRSRTKAEARCEWAVPGA